MEGFEKFYRKSWDQRLSVLKAEKKLTEKQILLLKQCAVFPEIGDTQIENFITQYHLPEGLALNFMIDGQEYLIPMVTEEPSVIAGASHGAAIVKTSGGFKTEIKQRAMRGQVVIENVSEPEKLRQLLLKKKNDILRSAAASHPSIIRRDGGPLALRVRVLAKDLVSLDLIIDTKEAMGANMINTMLEAVAEQLRHECHLDVLMAILSNYSTECLTTSVCRIKTAALAKKGLSGSEIAHKVAQASRVAQLDPYRAVTHNKGIMNGIDAVVIASGNDWRATEAAIQAYAARDGQYRGLSTWQVVDDCLCGSLTIPVPIGSVGGSISIVPLVKVNSQLRQEQGVKNLQKIIVSVGLAQNLAALYALVTDGIQQGHMNLQLKSLAAAAGAKGAEITQVVTSLKNMQQKDLATAKQILQEIRNKEHTNE